MPSLEINLCPDKAGENSLFCKSAGLFSDAMALAFTTELLQFFRLG